MVGGHGHYRWLRGLYPVTTGGQVAAAFIMAIGILTLAVVTAQVSSSFVDQAARRRAGAASQEPSIDAVTLADLAGRLGPDRGPAHQPVGRAAIDMAGWRDQVTIR